MEASMWRLSLGDVDLDFAERGSGEPLVLVHGGPFSNWFLPVSDSAALDGFRVVRVRRAGYGETPAAPHLTIHDHARHLGSLADALGIAAAHWVGHGSSCHIGLQLAIDRPALVRSLLLIEPAAVGGFTVPSSEELGREVVGRALGAFKAGHLRTAFTVYLGGIGGPDACAIVDARLGADGYEHAVRESAFFFQSEMRALLGWRFDDADAVRITQPVLVVEGVESAALGLLSREVTERARTLMPHAEVVFVEQRNHMLPLQDPETVAELAASFARQHPIVAGL